MNSVHLLFSDAALPMVFVGMGAPEDHEAALGLQELGVFLLGPSYWFASLQGRLLGLALLAEGAIDVTLHGGIVLEEVLCLPPVEWAGGLERLLKVFWACTSPARLRSGGTVGHAHLLLPTSLSVLAPPVVVSLRRGRVVTTVTSTEVTGGLGFAAEVGLDRVLIGGVLGGDV